MSYLSKILTYSKWTLLTAGLGLVIQLGLYWLIAHKVDSADLGYYFLASALVFIPGGILEYSFVSSLIHTEKPTNEDYAAVFRINLKMVVWFVIAGGLLAYTLGQYYQQVAITKYYLFLVPVLLLLSYTSVHYARLKKNLLIKDFAMVELSALLVSAIITALLLFSGPNDATAIIVGQLAKYFMAALILSIMSKDIKIWQPISSELSQRHWNYGKYILVEKAFATGLTQLDTFFIHHFLGAQILGIYDLLKRMLLRPLISAYTAIEQVVFPMLCNTDTRTGYKSVFLGFIRANYIFLLTLLLVPMSRWILGFFPENYMSFHKEFQLLILLAVSMMLLNPVDIIAYSLDKTRKYLVWVLSYSIVQLAVTLVALSIGLPAFILAMVCFNIAVYLLSYIVIAKDATDVNFWQWSQLALLLGLFTICFTLF